MIIYNKSLHNAAKYQDQKNKYNKTSGSHVPHKTLE